MHTRMCRCPDTLLPPDNRGYNVLFIILYLNVIDCMITNCDTLNTEPNLFDDKDFEEDLESKIDRMYKTGESESETAPPFCEENDQDRIWEENYENNNNDNEEDEDSKLTDEEFDKLLDEFLYGDEKDTEKRIKSPFVDEEIEQNQGLSVKVRVLLPTDNPQEELDKLVGCNDIKSRLAELVALTQYNDLMRLYYPKSKQHAVSLHSIFFGSPGTGKTTVCKIFGSLLHKAGALSSGHVVVCDRSTFLGTLWGDEERAIRHVLERAQGGVLMIDEAYLFNTKNDHDPGKLVIQQLMTTLADETQRDIAIVLCGYKEPMKKLLELNPGLDSRFPNRFEFTDFNVDELLEITRRRVGEYDYRFTNQAWEKYRQMLTQAYQERDPQTWGNARFVANQLERIYVKHALRCVNHLPDRKSDMRKLTPEDIQPIEVSKPRPRIGF